MLDEKVYPQSLKDTKSNSNFQKGDPLNKSFIIKPANDQFKIYPH